MHKCLFLIILTVSFSTVADETRVNSCKSSMMESLANWYPVPLEGELLHIKNEYKYDPTVAFGDFDADNKRDVALLVEKSGSKKIRAIAVCLSSKEKKGADLITNLYVDEQISVTGKGTEYYNYETGKKDEYSVDGITVSCCECCGATYIYIDGKFKQVIDSD